jgi:hypothetical protein
MLEYLPPSSLREERARLAQLHTFKYRITHPKWLSAQIIERNAASSPHFAAACPA